MFKKLSIISSVVLLAACSSSNTVSDNYVDDVVVQKNNQETYTQIVGKEIIPVDLLEHNLALKVSVLDVVANISNDTSNPVDSVVNFELQYSEANTGNSEQQEFAKYSTVTIADTSIAVSSESASRDCDDVLCTVTQSLSFPIATELLQNGQQDGVKFLLQQSDNSELQLETMIPGRYLTALFAK